MTRAIVYLLLGDAIFAAACSTAAGGWGANGVGTTFAVVSMIAWAAAAVVSA